MIVYLANQEKFREDILSKRIEEIAGHPAAIRLEERQSARSV